MSSYLDTDATYVKHDPTVLRHRLRDLPRQCQRAWEHARRLRLPRDYTSVDKVLVLGLGGSAIGGDLLADLASMEQSPPITVHRDYGLPSWVDKRTLVVVSTYSGNTEETLSGFDEAVKREAKVIVSSSGGKALELAAERDLPAFKISYEGEPRSALAWSFLPLVWVCQRLGLINDKSKDLAEAVVEMDHLVGELGDDVPSGQNQAKALAKRLHNRIAVIYGAAPLNAVARRWKAQVNENSKAWAFFELLPELNHNAVVGYPFPKDMPKNAYVVLLRSSHTHERTLRRQEATGELLQRVAIPHETVDARGKSVLAQQLSTILIGDYTSLYLAILNRVDPSPVDSITFLKDFMAKG